LGGIRLRQCGQGPRRIQDIAALAPGCPESSIAVLLLDEGREMHGVHSGQLLCQGLPGEDFDGGAVHGIDGGLQIGRQRLGESVQCHGSLGTDLDGQRSRPWFIHQLAIGLYLPLQPLDCLGFVSGGSLRQEHCKANAQPPLHGLADPAYDGNGVHGGPSLWRGCGYVDATDVQARTAFKGNALFLGGGGSCLLQHAWGFLDRGFEKKACSQDWKFL
jgi:hypothetical protein